MVDTPSGSAYSGSRSSDWEEENPHRPAGVDSDSLDFSTSLEQKSHIYAQDIPRRLRKLQSSVVREVNDWHLPMMNDLPRNETYKLAINKFVTEDDTVLEIGAGSGILSILAAKAGARHVYAIDGNREFCKIVQTSCERNGCGRNVTVVNEMSKSLQVMDDHDEDFQEVPKGFIPKRCTVLIAEILGTMLDAESSIYYFKDARKRLLTPDAKIIPARGRQYATLIGSEQLKQITQASTWDNLNLAGFNKFRDSVNLVFSKTYGVNLNRLGLEYLSEPMLLFDYDYTSGAYIVPDRDGNVPYDQLKHSSSVTTFHDVNIIQSGEAIALMFWWEAYLDSECTMVISTHPRETVDNVPRDLNWGQGIILVEGPNGWEHDIPTAAILHEGDVATVRYTFDPTSPNLFSAKLTYCGEHSPSNDNSSEEDLENRDDSPDSQEFNS